VHEGCGVLAFSPVVEGDAVGEGGGPVLVIDHGGEGVRGDEERRQLPLVPGGRLLEMRAGEGWVGEVARQALDTELDRARVLTGSRRRIS
jgi:hypothetical protein